MLTFRTSLTVIAVVSALAFSACHDAAEEDALGVQEAQEAQGAQDLAWGYVRDPSAGPAHFLVQNGAGSLAETNAYYASIIKEFAPSTLTLSTWRAQFITGDTVSAFYRNKNELGFWRDMTCTETIHRGAGGCMVTNYKNETDKAQHLPNLGTVAMTVSPEGFARFYVFLPNGVLSPSALLDDEGPKFAPRLCTVCHSGSDPAPDQNPDLGSIFREFEPSLLQAQTGLSRPDAEAQWFDLNQAIRAANQSIRGEAEGAPRGVDHAKAAMSAHLDELYPDLAPPARSITDPSLTPVSWQADATNAKLWGAVVAPYCMGCHRHNADDWAVYSNFDYLQDAKDGVGLLRQYTTGVNGAHPYPFMPQAQLTYNRLGADHAAQSAIDAWLPCPSGQSCVPANPCHKGAISCQAGAPFCSDTGSAAADGTPCGDHGTCAGGSCRVGQQCNPTVLFLADSLSSDVDTRKVAQAMTAAGLQPTVVSNGTTTFAGDPSAQSFGAILVSPGRGSTLDMNPSGQSAIVSANALGAGVVFTEWSDFELNEHHYAQLAPLILLRNAGPSGFDDSLTFTLTAAGHPIWTGLPTTFTTTAIMRYSSGAAGNGGTPIAQVKDSTASPSPGVLVREATSATGRLVDIAHAASFTPGWESDTRTMLMFTNALRWAARCL